MKMDSKNIARNLAVVPVPVLITLIIFFGILHTSAKVIEPPYLFPILNTVFLFLVSCVVAYVAMRSYLASGSSTILLLGTGVLVFGTGSFASGWTIVRWGVNVSATVHNAPLLLAAIFHICGVIASAREHPPETDPVHRRWKLFAAYITAPVFVLSVFLLSVEGIMPVFFVAGVGTTALRQAVLASAFVLLIYSSSYMMTRFFLRKEPYLYWYSLALALLAVMSAGFYIQPAIGSPVGWIGRGAQYLAGVYFIVSVISAKREAQMRGVSLNEAVADLFLSPGFHWQDILKTALNGFSIVDTKGRYLEVNEACCRILGYTRGELLSMTIADVETVESPSDVLSRIDVLKEKKTAHFVSQNRRKDGSIIDVEVNATYLDIGTGQLAVFFQDITERKQAEGALKENERVKSELLDKLNQAQRVGKIGSWDWDLRSDHAWWSDETYHIFGVTPQNFVPSFASNGTFIHPDDIAQYGKAFDHSLQTGEPLDFDVRLVLRDGLLKHCNAKGIIIYDHAGQPLRFVGTIMDITERKRAEEALQTHRQLLETVVNYMPASVNLIRGSDLKLQLINPAYQAIALGKDMVGKTLDELWPEARKNFEELCSKVLATGEPYHVQDEMVTIRRRPDGPLEPTYFSWSLYRVRLPGDEGWGILNTAWETTERMRAETALRESKNELEERVKERTYELYEESLYARSLIEASLDPLVTISIDGKIMDANHASEVATGMLREQLIGSDFSDYFTEPEKARAGYEEVFRQGFVRDYPLELKRKDGHVTPVLYNASVYRDETGKIMGIFAAARDITERKQAEAALRRLASELVMAEERERKRIAGVLHDEVAQTLAAAKMRIDLLQRIPYDQEDKHILKDAKGLLLQSIQETRALMTDIGNPLLSDLGLQAACESHANRLMERYPVRISCDIQDAYKHLNPDVKTILYQLIRELLNNVVKHSRALNANVMIDMENGYFRVKVTDDGVGFDPQKLGAPTVEGGFGLYSIRERLIAIDGSLKIESAPGTGTVVTAILPEVLH
jgi:PAS domain S-box-containing protein